MYAAFGDLEAAKTAIGALIRGGVPASDITLACKHLQNQVQATDIEAGGGPSQAGFDAEPSKLKEADQEYGAMTSTFSDMRVPGPGGSANDASMDGSGSRLAAMAATANASTNPGTMTDYLWSTLSPEMADFYQHQYNGGKAIIIVRGAESDAEQILRDQGALSIQKQGYLA